MFNICKLINVIHHINKLKDKKSYDHLNRCRKNLKQNPTSTYDKNASKIGHRGNLSQHSEGHIWKAHSKFHSQWWKTKRFPSKISNKKRVSTLTTIIQHSFVSPSYSNQRTKRNKNNPYQKRRSKALPVCKWQVTVIENPKETIRKLLALIS